MFDWQQIFRLRWIIGYITSRGFSNSKQNICRDYLPIKYFNPRYDFGITRNEAVNKLLCRVWGDKKHRRADWPRNARSARQFLLHSRSYPAEEAVHGGSFNNFFFLVSFLFVCLFVFLLYRVPSTCKKSMSLRSWKWFNTMKEYLNLFKTLTLPILTPQTQYTRPSADFMLSAGIPSNAWCIPLFLCQSHNVHNSYNSKIKCWHCSWQY